MHGAFFAGGSLFSCGNQGCALYGGVSEAILVEGQRVTNVIVNDPKWISPTGLRVGNTVAVPLRALVSLPGFRVQSNQPEGRWTITLGFFDEVVTREPEVVKVDELRRSRAPNAVVNLMIQGFVNHD